MPIRRRSALPRLVLLAAAALVLLLLGATAAAAKGSARFHRGHLPAIGEIALAKTQRGLVAISVPVTYTKAVAGRDRGLETSEVTLHVARKLTPAGTSGLVAERTHRHRIDGNGTVRDRFVLGAKASRELLGIGRKLRGRLVRVDVRHRIRERPGGKPMHVKAASSTMVSSHRAHPQGIAGFMTVRNDTGAPVNTASTPILCMYTNGEEGSNLQLLSTSPGHPLYPGGTIEAEIEADGSILDTAHYQGPNGQSAGAYFDWLGVGAEWLANEFDVEATPFSLLIDMTTNCFAQASTFQIFAEEVPNWHEQGGEAPPTQSSSSEAWVITSQTGCKFCPTSNFITAYNALQYQGVGEEQVNPGIWGRESTKIIEGLVGGWRTPPAGGKIVADQGLHWQWRELAERVEEIEEFNGEEIELHWKQWEVSIHEGSSPAGFSG
jgi:hypothetical protein